MNPVRIAVLLLLIATSALAQQFRTVALVPLGLGEQEGAYSSRWSTTLSIHNKGDATITNALCPGQGWAGLQPPLTTIPPNATVQEDWRARARPSTLICFEDAEPADLAFSLQVRELGNDAAAPPVEIPVVLHEDFLHGTAALVDIPLAADTRAALRIYDTSGDNGTIFRLQAFDPAGNELLDELLAPAGLPTFTEPPGYILIQNLAVTFPMLQTHERVTLQVAPFSAQVPFWTFVSVTDNETQHLTVFTP